MDSDSNERLVVWQRPCVSVKAQGPFVVLKSDHDIVSFLLYWGIFETYRLTRRIFAMRFRTRLKTCFTSRETVLGEGKWYPGRPVFISD